MLIFIEGFTTYLQPLYTAAHAVPVILIVGVITTKAASEKAILLLTTTQW